MLLTVYRYAEYRFVLVEKTKSANNVWEMVFEDVIILGFLMANTSSKRQNIYIIITYFVKYVTFLPYIEEKSFLHT